MSSSGSVWCPGRTSARRSFDTAVYLDSYTTWRLNSEEVELTRVISCGYNFFHIYHPAAESEAFRMDTTIATPPLDGSFGHPYQFTRRRNVDPPTSATFGHEIRDRGAKKAQKSSAYVLGPGIPSATSPRAAWKRLIASFVFAPITPSSRPTSNPLSCNAVCNSSTV